MKIDKNNIDIISDKFFEGTASLEESEALVNWLDESKHNRLYYFSLKRMWLEKENHAQIEHDTGYAWSRFRLRLQESKHNKSHLKSNIGSLNLRIGAVAASVTIVFVAIGILSLGIFKTELIGNNINKIEVPYGSRTNLVLPDGSDVWLNSGSTLTYNSNFNKKVREVYLTGEAFFDVKKRYNSKFVVQTDDLKIRVLGTKFNVKSYPDEKTIETTLIEGKVEVFKEKKDKTFNPITLAPNEKLIFKKGKGEEENKAIPTKPEQKRNNEKKQTKTTVKEISEMQVNKVENPLVDISWKEEKLIIEAEKLGHMSRKLERYYGVEIYFEDERIKDFKYSGTLDNVTIEEVLKAIVSSSPLVIYRINNSKITLSIKEEK